MSKIMVIGIGGVGGYIASLLSKEYQDVTVVARGKRYDSIVNNGLILNSDIHGKVITYPTVVKKASDANEQDYIFICVKNYSLKEVLKQIEPCLKEDTIVVPILNGVDHGKVCEKYLSRGKVVDSLIYIVSSYLEDYSIKQQGDYAYLYVGGKNEAENQLVCDLLNNAQIDCALASSIETELWNKYILNCAFNTLTAYYNCTNTEIRVSKIRCLEYKALLQEAYTVAIQDGVQLEADLVEKLYNHFMHNQPNHATSSLARDIQSKNDNELETFCGYLVRKAKKLNVSVPQMNFFYQELKRKSL